MNIPAHKVIGDVGKPGQIIKEPSKKLSFEEWYKRNKPLISFNYDQAQLVWKAAQENK